MWYCTADLGAEYAVEGLPANVSGDAASLIQACCLIFKTAVSYHRALPRTAQIVANYSRLIKNWVVNKVFRLGDKTAARALMNDFAGSVAIGHLAMLPAVAMM